MMTKSEQFEKNANERKTPIMEKDILKAFKHKIVKEGNDWVIRQDGKEVRNANKKEAIRDWFTINNYLVK